MIKKVRNKMVAILIGVVMLQSSVTAFAAQTDAGSTVPSGLKAADISIAVESYAKEHENTTAGMSVAVYDNDSVLYQGGFGYADKENELTVTDTTVYDWGSTSKLLIWVSVMQLVEQGKLDLQKDVKEYLPEGFLQNLTYEKEITMLDLMSHQAGFQETYFIQTANVDEVVSLEEALSVHQPKQIFEPGSCTAYSNWGAALAALIVQRISGMDYAEYVHKNIFEPLGMEHTSIGAVYQDNTWVKEQREKLVCYDTDGERIPGKGQYYIILYPAGSAAGTIGDLLLFAQAITPDENRNCPLFEKQETLEQLYTPISHYGTSRVANNCHGFWVSQYGVATLGHGGNTFGCSTMIQFEPETGVGMVVMTNQAHEKVYNYDMYELIFGKFSDSELAALPRELPQGLIAGTRTITKGPLSIVGALGINGFSEEDLDTWWWQDGSHIYNGYSDNEVATGKTVLGLICCLLFFGAGLYGVVTVLCGGLIVSPVRRKLLKRKGMEIKKYPLQGWNYAVCGAMAVIFVDFVIMFLRLMNGNVTGNIGSVSGYMAQSGTICVFAVLLIFYLVWGLKVDLSRKQSYGTKAAKVKYIITTFLAVCMLGVIVKYDMYQFWAL